MALPWVIQQIKNLLAEPSNAITALGGTPSTQAFGDAAASGTSTAVPRLDHKHKMPAAPTLSGLGAQADRGITALGGTPAAETFGATALVGSSTAVARADHRHAMPAAPSGGMPLVKTSAGVGQITPAVHGTTSATSYHAYVPSGGTWLVFGISVEENQTNGFFLFGIYAGGSLIATGSLNSDRDVSQLLCWRIA